MARRFRVEGRVQGVAFRWFTQRTAESLSLRGWVRNLPDGSVEGTVCGDAAALEAFVEALAKGPPASRVTRVATEPVAHTPMPETFEIRRS